MPVPVTSTTMSIVPPATVSPAPVRVAVIMITLTPTFHPLTVVAFRIAGQGQTPGSENQQQTKNYDSLYFHVAPFGLSIMV